MNRRELLIRAGQLAASSVVAPAALLAGPAAAAECDTRLWAYCKQDVDMCVAYYRGVDCMTREAHQSLAERAS